MTPDQLGLVGPGKEMYERYRAAWEVYKHPLPEWGKLHWQARAIWNQLAAGEMEEPRG